ncbi:MAG: glutamyl-tRNA reductase [Fimbriimonadaceae bacterium]|nr:glutamyl-tRNA reductase [Chitinophagales bacterium]
MHSSPYAPFFIKAVYLQYNFIFPALYGKFAPSTGLLNRMNQYKVLSVSHKQVQVSELEKFIVPFGKDTAQYGSTLQALKETFHIQELMYLNTCNRVNFFISAKDTFHENFPAQFFKTINPKLEACNTIAVDYFEGTDAVRHMCELGSSLDSMVLGEREILRQLRVAYEESQQMGLTGDDLRLAMKFIIPAAKRIYTETKIAEKPVSIVSLAAHKLDAACKNKNVHILFIGSGETNKNMAAHLMDSGYKNFTVFNRTIEHAKTFASKLNCEAYPLSELKNYKKHFDVIITCTASTEPHITTELYETILNGDKTEKIIVDLAVPYNTEKNVVDNFKVKYIDVGSLKTIAQKNIAARKEEKVKAKKLVNEFIKEFESIYIQRSIEKAHERIPALIHNIHIKATEEVFAKEIDAMDDESKETLFKVMEYLEKKYVALTIASAKESVKYKI